MKKLLSILICVLLGVSSATFAQVNLQNSGSNGSVTITATAIYNGQEATGIATVQAYGTRYWRSGISKKSETISDISIYNTRH